MPLRVPWGGFTLIMILTLMVEAYEGTRVCFVSTSSQQPWEGATLGLRSPMSLQTWEKTATCL